MAKLSLAMLSLAPALATANNGALPKGKAVVPNEEKSQEGKSINKVDCLKIFFHRNPALSYHNQGNASLYFISRLQEATTKDGARDYLLRYDYKNQSVRKLSALRLPSNSVLVPADNKDDGIIILTFQEDNPCFIGKGQGFGIRLLKPGYAFNPKDKTQHVRGILPLGFYFIARIDGFPAVVDMDAHAQTILDIASFQKRRGITFQPDEWPLEYQSSLSITTALRFKNSEPTLVKYDTTNNSIKSEVSIKDDNKILQDGSSIVFVKIEGQRNALSILEVKNWSGEENTKSEIMLPKEFSWENASISLDTKRKIAVVYLRDPLRSRRWDQSFIYNYLSNKLLGTVPLPKGLYVDSVTQTDKDGVIFIIKSYKNKSLSAIRHFSRETGKWEPVHIKIL